MSKIFDKILTITLIVFVIIFICRLIIEIKTMIEIDHPSECLKIDDDYYCKVHNETEKKDIFIM